MTEASTHDRPEELPYEEGRRAWPAIEVPREHFAAWVEARGCTPDRERAGDLYLACACAGRHDRAAAAFAAEYGADIERAVARVRAPGVSPDDVRQIVLQRILVGEPDRPPKIDGYVGRGTLRSWVRAVAVRAAIDLHRTAGDREVSREPTLLDNLRAASDPELDYLEQHYQGEFRRAFEVAVAGLSARDRNHLRHACIEKLTIDQLAALYGVHRSTAARRVATAREALLEATRAALIESLGVTDGELDSILRLLGSRVDVSVQRLLSDEG